MRANSPLDTGGSPFLSKIPEFIMKTEGQESASPEVAGTEPGMVQLPAGSTLRHYPILELVLMLLLSLCIGCLGSFSIASYLLPEQSLAPARENVSSRLAPLTRSFEDLYREGGSRPVISSIAVQSLLHKLPQVCDNLLIVPIFHCRKKQSSAIIGSITLSENIVEFHTLRQNG